MNQSTLSTSRRSFISGCLCAGCAGFAASATAVETGTDTTGNLDISCCGLYCSACKKYLKGDDKGVKCLRCRHPQRVSSCVIRACAMEKKLENCGLCPEFDTCEKLKKHHEKPIHRQAGRKNCKTIKAEGYAKTADEQKKRWTCPTCRKTFWWNDGLAACPHCGRAVAPLSEKDI